MHSPYYVEENVTWSKINDRITITIPINQGGSLTRNYKIVELRGSFMNVDFEEQNGESSENGKASKMYYELKKQ